MKTFTPDSVNTQIIYSPRPHKSTTEMFSQTSKRVYEFNIFVGETYTLQECVIHDSVFILDVAKCILFIFQADAILNSRNKL